MIAEECLRITYELHQRKYGKSRDRELCYDEDGRDCTELIIQGDIVDEEVGEPHQVMSPGESDREDRPS